MKQLILHRFTIDVSLVGHNGEYAADAASRITALFPQSEGGLCARVSWHDSRSSALPEPKIPFVNTTCFRCHAPARIKRETRDELERSELRRKI
jgi:hypothetical protein